MNGDSEEAALCFDGRNGSYHRRILLPEIRPGLLAGMALVFVWAFTDPNHHPMGFALTTVMGVVGLGGYWVSQWLGRGQAQSHVTSLLLSSLACLLDMVLGFWLARRCSLPRESYAMRRLPLPSAACSPGTARSRPAWTRRP